MNNSKNASKGQVAPRADHKKAGRAKKNSTHHQREKSRNGKSEAARKPIKSPAPGQLLIIIDGKVKSLAPSELLGAEKFTAVQEQCDGASRLVFHLHHLLDFTGEERFVVLDLVASLSVRPKFVVEGGDEPREDLLAAVLALMPDKHEIDKFGRGRKAALEVTALLHPDALEVACGNIVQAMRLRGIKGVRFDKLVSEANKLFEQINRSRARVASPQAPRLVRDVLPEAPVPKDTRVPADWNMTAADIRSSREGAAGEIQAPVVIAGRGKDVARDTEYACVAWFRDGCWHRRIVDREVLANAQKIIALAAYGLPVNSNNARLLVQYIADFETANSKTLPMAKVSRKLGLQGRNGELGFLWGRTLITAAGFCEGNNLSELAPEEWSQQAVHFQGADEGDDQLAAGFHSAGSFEGWFKAMRAVASYPKVRLAFYAALAAPLLAIIRAVNFIVDYAGETTSGKTVALRVAASSFGNPDEEAANGKAPAVFTWKATGVWRERAPTVINHLPFIMDDTKHAKHDEDVAETIYTIAQGRGKGRGTIKGTAAQETFSTVMLSSGEQPATSFTQDGGTRARVIAVWGSPFGARNQETGKLVRRLNDRIKCHYGHVGPRFVQFILKNRQQWKKWRDEYQQFVALWEGLAGDNAIAGRLAACFAAISVTASLVHQAIDLPWDYADPVAPLWNDLVKDAKDRAAAALHYVMACASAHEAEFLGCRDLVKSPPPVQGWAGRWNKYERPGSKRCEWDEIAFFPHWLEKILKDGEFEPRSTIRTWKDRGWLRLGSERNGTKRTCPKVRIGDDTERMIVVTRNAVDAADGEA